MTLAFILAQLADGLTYRPSNEANALVLAAGDHALLGKVLLIVFVLGVSYLLAQTRYRFVRPILLALGIIVGVVGAWSNIA